LPFLITAEGQVRVLLVTTRGRQGWIIPKGWPIRRLSAAATAAREAYEEAGLIGTVIGDGPLGSFLYEKRGERRRATFEVSVFLFAVERQLRKWPEKSQRTTRWLAPEEASLLVAPSGLADMLRGDFVGLVNDVGSGSPAAA
jgi:8-oxo-dGTP pyrophosphatase MutT (NUDIX family)